MPSTHYCRLHRYLFTYHYLECNELKKMYANEFLPLLTFQIRMCQRLNCTPFEFHQRSGRFKIIKVSRIIRIFKLQGVLSVIYCAAMFLNISFGPLTLSKKLQGLVLFVACITASIARWNWTIDVGPIQIINTFLDFEEKILECKLKFL